ncbi:MAG TPA: hypothetical protein PLV25_06215, partial [Opitutales bacterium]|nr:hypothetical protein [Opitutales bacterium]
KMGAKRIIFLDSDTLVCAPFEGLEELMDEHWALFTPHIVQIRTKTDYMAVACILNGGAINSGIVCVRNCETGRSLLNWWCERIYRYGLSDGRGLHGDQKWLDLLPGLYTGYYILKDIGYNVAHWNLCERTLSLKNNTFWVNDTTPLRLFHYATLDWRQPNMLFKLWASPEVKAYREIVLIVNLYRMLVYQSFAVKSAGQEPSWAYRLFDNGTAASGIIRRLYHGLCQNLSRFKTPYKTSGPDSFYEWLNTRVDPKTRLTYLFISIRRWKDWETCYPILDGHQGLKLVIDILRSNHTLGIPREFFLPLLEPLENV